MSTPLRALLAEFRNSAKTEREKGNYFERLAVDFIKNDHGMAQEYEDAWLYSEWAQLYGSDGRDTGIDVVAKIRGEDSFCAIQCKFYREDHRIQKADIDSFFTASGKRQFSRRLIIDTTDAPWSANAEDALSDQDKPISRIGLDRLEESPIDWSVYLLRDEVKVAPPKSIRPHQQDALQAVCDGLAEADRGKLIMACGTGKTFTGLKIAEDMAGSGKMVLFLVPSLALMSQTIREWTIDTATPLRAFAVCSDVQVGKRRKSTSDVAEIETHDLDYPATTNAEKLADKVAHSAPDRMTVVFSTYQSIQVISDAQQKHGLPEFDLIICDEAHRTTGATLDGEDESNFVKIHSQDFIAGKKRLYMTATPRVFGDAVKSKASEASAVLCSMDDESLYGKTLFARGFGWAVENQLLADYKVLVLAVDEQMVSGGVQNRLADGSSELKLDDATKIIGCYKALTKHGLKDELLTDPQPMKRALAFCKDIATSKLVQSEFAAVIHEYLASDEGKETEGDATPLDCQLEHVDGTFNAKARNRLLDWLKEEHGDHACRILTNARCLSEGVDVPALDAILFMHPRKSQIDVVQSVGRVMRRAPGKNMGYVILPIGVPAGMTPEEALNDNERYRVVWQILNALRSHDERFDAMINKADLGVDISDHIEVIAVSNKLPTKKTSDGAKTNIGHGSAAGDDEREQGDIKPKDPVQGAFFFDEFSKAIMAKIVRKCGRRDYWEDWASDIAKIAQTHITRITALVEKPDTTERAAFEAFLAEIKDDLNDSITEGEAIEMLAQHIITRPVFEALFDGYSFAQNNPVSKAMQAVLDALDEHSLEKEAESLAKFYESVRRRAAGIDKADAKQKIIVELYDKFFRNAFPKMTERLGIVYTPVEVVDFILHSVNEVLQSEFGQTLGSKGVQILDPFTGTGTFIARLLQSGLIKPEELELKYRHEIHANEIVLLAYYIAAINIEAAFHGLAGGDYVPFEGICLTDTFQMYEKDDLISKYMPENSERRKNQKLQDIKVIIGNPPYSSGQQNENDNNKNVYYKGLDERISTTYIAASSNPMGKSKSYNSYIRAIRWGADQLQKAGGGIMAFVTDAGWIESNATDGMRAVLADEFSKLYIFHLRGNARTSGERRRKEKGNVFGEGSRSPIAISLLVMNPSAEANGSIMFHDIGDYLSEREKLDKLSYFQSIKGISDCSGWRRITPNASNDWIDQRDEAFSAFIQSGGKKSAEPTLFSTYSMGVKSNRDDWVYNYSKDSLKKNVELMLSTYNSERRRLASVSSEEIDNLVSRDSRSIKWTTDVISMIKKGEASDFSEVNVRQAIYRPFQKCWWYADPAWNWTQHLMPSFFPEDGIGNLAICVSGVGAGKGFSALMVDEIPNLHIVDTGQSFPLRTFKKYNAQVDDLFNVTDSSTGYISSSGITDTGLALFQSAYPNRPPLDEDVFYYVYALMHSEDYKSRFNENLTKELPRIPPVKGTEDFWAFVEAGRKLGNLHCNFETVEPYPVTFVRGDTSLVAPSDPEAFYRVEQMKFAGKRPNLDKTTVIYNANITISGIPLEAYDYVVNGKPAIEWVIERQCVKTDKASGIVNDANRYAIETVGDPAYPLKLLQRVITVSLETMKIVRSLPSLGDLS